jgi:hypothetical protein
MTKHLGFAFPIMAAVLLTSCGPTPTPVVLYAQTIDQMVTIEDALDQEVEYQAMMHQGPLATHQPYFMESTMMANFQNEWIEIRELVAHLKETQRQQNQLRVLIRMDASIIRAYASVMDAEAIVLSTEDLELLSAAQTELATIRGEITTLNQSIRGKLQTIRQLFRSVGRPMMWTETLISSIDESLQALLVLTTELNVQLNALLPAIGTVKTLLATIVPSELSPLTPAVTAALDLFHSQFASLITLQEAMIAQRLATRTVMISIREKVRELRSQSIALTNEQKAQLMIKRLAIADAVASLKANGESLQAGLASLKGQIAFTNLTTINATLLELITNGETRLVTLGNIQQMFVEVLAILNA